MARDDPARRDDPAPGRPIRERIEDQFSYRGEHAEIWRAFDRFLDTDAFLNLGYSPWYLPHVVGSSQRRLARVVGEGLAARLEGTADVPLLDVGCGRGGPTTLLAGSFGFDVVGVDLVPYNVDVARRNAAREGVPVEFVVGDAAWLPIAGDAVVAATAIDSLLYVPETGSAVGELARVVRPGGVAAVSTLLTRGRLGDVARSRVDAFAAAWDMPAIDPAAGFFDDLEAAGFAVEEVRDLSPHSIRRFPRWTGLYLAMSTTGLPERALGMWGLDADGITEQVRATHEAVAHLEHVLVYARRTAGPEG